MTSPSFAFVPRNISKGGKQQGTCAHVPSSESSHSLKPTPAIERKSAYPGSSGSDKGKQKVSEPPAKPVYNEKDISVLAVLAFSDYALWLDSDLRRKTEESLQGEEQDAGFLPLSYLMRRAFGRENLGQDYMPTEANVVKAIRAYAGDVLEVRMLVSAPSASGWYPSWKPERGSVGGYEVRRKDWTTLLDNATREFTRGQWDDRTIYMENIPAQYHTIPGIIRFAQGLLSHSSCLVPIQNVILPPHHLDKAEDRPKCKGFALVTLGNAELCRMFLESWPWTRLFQPESDDFDLAEGNLDTKEASKFGFRTLPKARWDKLNEEYLAYRQKLISELADANEPPDISPDSDVRDVVDDVLEDTPAPPRNVTTMYSPYPFGCLVFARNLHLETNKTTLRALFCTAFESSLVDPAGIDYVDFNKGMDSCYLRLASPEHGRVLVDRFSSHPVVQSHGLDGIGKTPEASQKAIATEIIEGKKEEVYWEKVPEKVRRQAVEKAVKALNGKQSSTSVHTAPEHSEESRPRKKRNRG
ncbi:uncharacterized protein F5891DRAFT_998933 [Suillus fuscotomentosus]|uniref:XRRM domain-containing protein n=1 Tax=Suillus fuscotomentosus TaxID=1912939 RepID=A0AAD4EIG9_9AGAM|nr:uncharacterized protein F5891DRAFT_998933 [Suillus fuscotomentosus]KAG1906833.1 hypothetical protein F5891DRAFT_998933 [Suillus fuscotomentosus]